MEMVSVYFTATNYGSVITGSKDSEQETITIVIICFRFIVCFTSMNGSDQQRTPLQSDCVNLFAIVVDIIIARGIRLCFPSSAQAYENMVLSKIYSM